VYDNLFYLLMQDEAAETTIGKNVIINGQLKFDRLVRIDGSFTGQLVSRVSFHCKYSIFIITTPIVNIHYSPQ
jgi:cytoskeletal protein CcmA (bactofilin family)